MDVPVQLAPRVNTNVHKHGGHLLTFDLTARHFQLGPRSNINSRYQVREYDVVAAMVSDGEKPCLRVFTKSGRPGTSATTEQWLHIVADFIPLADVKKFVIDAAAQRGEECARVAEALLNHIDDEHEHTHPHGSYIRPGTVLRCDGIRPRNMKGREASVAFISFPYFDVGQDKGPAAVKTDHNVRSLYQQFYPREETQDLDREQKYRSFMNLKNDLCLRAPQFWIFILESATVITCGPTELEELTPGFLNIVEENDIFASWPSLVQVYDSENRVTYLPKHQCNTYDALRGSIEKYCFSRDDGKVISYCIYTADGGTELSAEEWFAITRDPNIKLIRIRISSKRSISVPVSAPNRAVQTTGTPSPAHNQYIPNAHESHSECLEVHCHQATRNKSVDTTPSLQPANIPGENFDQERLMASDRRTQNSLRSEEPQKYGVYDARRSTMEPEVEHMPASAHTAAEPELGRLSTASSQVLTEEVLRQLIRDEISAAMRSNDGSRFCPEASSKQKTNTCLSETNLQENHLADEVQLKGLRDRPLDNQAYAGPSKKLLSNVASQSAYLKIPTKDLEAETLEYYEIPYSADEELGYYHILRNVTRREIDILFEHTERLRTRPEPIRRRPRRIHRYQRNEHIAAKALDCTRPRPTILDDGKWSDQNYPSNTSSEQPALCRHLTPETRILVLLNYLIFSPIGPDGHILRHYQDYLRDLVRGRKQHMAVRDYHKLIIDQRYKTNAAPSKAALKELYLFEEEVEVVASVITQQKAAFTGLQVAFDSATYRAPTQFRIEAFTTIEKAIITDVQSQGFGSLENDIQAMIKESRKLAEAVRHSIAIAEEGDSKAIFVFTLVTIIFLPLSFISSVFGMNTADFRETSSTQTLFWAIAIPVTMAIGGLSLLAAYGQPLFQHRLKNPVQILGSKKGLKPRVTILDSEESVDESTFAKPRVRWYQRMRHRH